MRNLQKIPLFMVRTSIMILMVLMSSLTWAQDKGLDIDVDVNERGNWYSNPIVWVIAAAVFILLLVALLRGNKSS